MLIFGVILLSAKTAENLENLALERILAKFL